MPRRRVERHALNRGTAVYLEGSRVRFIWACGCKRAETLERVSPSMAARLVRNWRANGVVLPQCKRHPEWYDKQSQLPRLNAENPDTKNVT